jgi:hypothetical protein
MNQLTVKNLADGKYYTLGKNGFVESDNINKILTTKLPQTIVHTPTVTEPITPLQSPQIERFHLTIKKMDLAEFCMQKDELNNKSDCAVVFTDIFYSGYYKKRKFFLNATYICENQIDLNYFSRYLGVSKILSQKTETIEDENTILINPRTSDSTYKNVIYTTILGNMPSIGTCNAICTHTPKTIYIEDTEFDLQLIPLLDFMIMSNDFVYTPRQEMSQDDTFRMIFGHLMKHDIIRITYSMYLFINDKYINKMKLFFQIEEKFATYNSNISNITSTTTTTGDALFINTSNGIY